MGAPGGEEIVPVPSMGDSITEGGGGFVPYPDLLAGRLGVTLGAAGERVHVGLDQPVGEGDDLVVAEAAHHVAGRHRTRGGRRSDSCD